MSETPRLSAKWFRDVESGGRKFHIVDDIADPNWVWSICPYDWGADKQTVEWSDDPPSNKRCVGCVRALAKKEKEAAGDRP
jgi:hypothetical protein